ncbi:MAG: cytochrome P450 [Mycobacteriaceae bacterium]|nr:cytochrome P450 [Mycobacteriaceae bacterium]
MTATIASGTREPLPLAPKNPMRYHERLTSARLLTTGAQRLCDAGGPVTRTVLAPKWLLPPLVFISSPQGARDLLGRTDALAERGAAPVITELRRLMGSSLFTSQHEEWLPRRRALQPIFTKQHVARFAGHMADAAELVAGDWFDGTEIDLDAQCRKLTMRALGRSVLGVDLDERADAIAPALRSTLKWVVDRSLRPVKAPRWFPTPAQRRARTANAALHDLAADILRACRLDADRDAPLVRALIDTTDPQTGRKLADGEICAELVVFVLAGHDTTSTTLSYALWALGCDQVLQERVVDEVSRLGDRQLTPDDVRRLSYTGRVVAEALRLCPPAAAIGRLVMQDIEVDGYRLEEGTVAVVAIYAMHRDPSLWDAPLAFDPDRFSPQRSRGRSRWQYLPFGGGPRKCIGDHFAVLEATLALATIVRRVQVCSLDDQFPIETPFTTVAAAPIRARVRQRRPGRSRVDNRRTKATQPDG